MKEGNRMSEWLNRRRGPEQIGGHEDLNASMRNITVRDHPMVLLAGIPVSPSEGGISSVQLQAMISGGLYAAGSEWCTARNREAHHRLPHQPFRQK